MNSREHWILALFVGASVTIGGLAPVPASAAPAGSRRKPDSGIERSSAFQAEGDAAFDRADYEDAIAKYSAAYYVLTAEERASYAGSIPVRKAMLAYDELVAHEAGRTLIERQLGLITEYLELVKDSPNIAPEIIEELELKRASVEKKLADVAQATTIKPIESSMPEPATSESEPDEPDETPPEIVAPPSGPDDSPASLSPSPASDTLPRSKTAIALLAAGGVTAGVGAGVLSGWWTVRRQAPRLADMEPGYEEGTAERDVYLEREESRARRYLAAGVSVMSVGVVASAVGLTLALRNRSAARSSVGVTPHLTPSHAGLTLRGRF